MSKRLDLKKLSSSEVEGLSKERPYALDVIQMQILYDMADLLEELVERNTRFQSSWEETIPYGELKPIDLTITATTELSPKTISTMPWMTLDIFNDGPNPVYVTINEDLIRRKAPLRIGESLKIDMKKRKIEKVLLFCDPGNTAGLRLFAKR